MFTLILSSYVVVLNASAKLHNLIYMHLYLINKIYSMINDVYEMVTNEKWDLWPLKCYSEEERLISLIYVHNSLMSGQLSACLGAASKF